MNDTETQLIRVGHSPDPDDAFMFHALANDKIDTGRFTFTHELQDIETLNHRALKAELELTAVSLHGYAYLTDTYAICSCGASIGEKYGPMVVARDPLTVEDWATTIYHQMGIVADKELMAPGDRPVEIVDGGEVRKELIA